MWYCVARSICVSADCDCGVVCACAHVFCNVVFVRLFWCASVGVNRSQALFSSVVMLCDVFFVLQFGIHDLKFVIFV